MHRWTVPLLLASHLLWTAAVSADEKELQWYCNLTQSDSVEIKWVETPFGSLKTLAVVAEERSPHGALVVFLHADSPFRNPVYQYGIARDIAQFNPDFVALSILRPGYADDCGHQSDGLVGRKMGDNYTATVVSALVDTIRAAQREWRTDQTIVIGHSGGAALAALIASLDPDVQDRTVLVACPCDLSSWRKSMAELTLNSRWLEPMPGLSPVDHVEGLDPAKRIDLWVGNDDVVTPLFLSEAYAEKAEQSGKKVTVQLVVDGEHDMILRADTLVQILESLAD